MENDILKYWIIYWVDTGAARGCIVQVLIKDSLNNLKLEVPLTEEEINKTIDELLLSEELVYDDSDKMLYVTEFMPRMASKITGKNYTAENVKQTFNIYRSKI